jgi:hypothetical protein
VPPENLQSTTIEQQILTARNTIFEEELWQELNREARDMANQGVRLIGEDIVCPLTSEKKILLNLQPLEEIETSQEQTEHHEDDHTAEMISLSLHLLLSYAHRQNLRRRSQPPPPLSLRPPPNPPYMLLRPILALVHHESIISTLTNTLAPLSKALNAAGVCDSSYSLVAPVPLNNSAVASLAKSTSPAPERVIDSLILNLSGEYTIPLIYSSSITQLQSLTIRFRTSLSPLITRFSIDASGPLLTSCIPSANPLNVREVEEYILWATSCALARMLTISGEQSTGKASDSDERENMGDENENGEMRNGKWDMQGWRRTHNPTVLRKPFQYEMDSKELSFEVVADKAVPAVEIRAVLKYIGSAPGDGQRLGMKGGGKIRHIWKGEGVVNGTMREVDGSGDGEEVTLRQFVEQAGKEIDELRRQPELVERDEIIGEVWSS